MHTGLSSQVTGSSCNLQLEVVLVRSGRCPGRTTQRQSGPVRRGRRTAVLQGFLAGCRIRPAGRWTSGRQSGPARTSGPAGTSGPEAGVAELIAGPLLGLLPTARFPPTYKYPFF
jgi:hypothetical protein